MDAVRPRRARRVAALLVAAVLAVVPAGCGRDTEPAHPYGATQAHIGESLAALGWNTSVANLRFASDHVLIDVDAAAADPSAPRANPADLRFGLYGALAHPIEATGLGSCAQVQGADISPLTVHMVGSHPTGSAERSVSGRSPTRLRSGACTCIPRATASPAPRSPTRPPSRWACRRPTSTTPGWC